MLALQTWKRPQIHVDGLRTKERLTHEVGEGFGTVLSDQGDGALDALHGLGDVEDAVGDLDVGEVSSGESIGLR